MDIRRLQAFCKVYELKSFSRAGEELLLSQPTVSAHIMALESELGTRLFDRMGRTVLPTPAACVLYRYSLEAFDRLENARTEIFALTQRVSGELSIGGSTIPAHYILPGVVAAFRARYPDVAIDLTVGDTQEITERVADGQLSLGVVGAAMDHPDVVCELLMEDELVCIAPPALELPPRSTGEGVFDAEFLRLLPWVIREQGSGTRRAFENSLRQQGMDIRELRVSIMAHSTLAVLQCVKAGLGVSVTSRLACDGAIERGEIRQVEMPGLSIVRGYYRVHHAKRHIFPAMRRFLEILSS
ncbi:selenium metabolism-associated LysR family transcriptional regulator [Desulfolutivibrio sulfoxidireducens]|uniref:selenium metabolism-associated LysR family transcriptional regulator n=1 Tax=Desulfolutivibrio sulfoxidireducens TaxID=2773299 RepID=UPI00159E98DA|nr:selenium metabolism-associated LysR family transcriptional regulator [Desulfolutivibrio sulfoxidireducens]QLA15638.1 LysR family transcriptional regulator [Desulfolutivibrio sulfoxidireducens]QLA19244.1 LysR family transcriptional regulator [Desulfolutivibrio sulfoxidireducens]